MDMVHLHDLSKSASIKMSNNYRIHTKVPLMCVLACLCLFLILPLLRHIPRLSEM